MAERSEQLCWTCTKAEDCRLCPWAGGNPRDDWDAEPVKIRARTDNIDSFIIHSCPAYEEDKEMMETPKPTARIPTEAQEQTTLFKWTRYTRATYPELALLFHIPNEGARSTITGVHLRQQGMKKGVPDLFLPVARGEFHGLFIEMKSKNGRPTAEQKWWLDRLRQQGYRAEVCYGCDEAIQVLEDYLDRTAQS